MSFDYAEIAQTVQELLEEFGAPGKLTRKDRAGVYDPDLGDYPEVEVAQDCTAVVFPIDQKLVDGTAVLATDEQAYLSAVSLTTPTPSHKLTWQGKGYTIVRAKNLAPAGVSVLVELIVRK